MCPVGARHTFEDVGQRPRAPGAMPRSSAKSRAARHPLRAAGPTRRFVLVGKVAAGLPLGPSAPREPEFLRGSALGEARPGLAELLQSLSEGTRRLSSSDLALLVMQITRYYGLVSLSRRVSQIVTTVGKSFVSE